MWTHEIPLTVMQTLNIIVFDIFPPLFHTQDFSDDDLPQWFWNNVLPLDFAIILKLSWTIHAVRKASYEGFSLLLWMHGIARFKSDFVVFVVEELLHADQEFVHLGLSGAHPKLSVDVLKGFFCAKCYSESNCGFALHEDFCYVVEN